MRKLTASITKELLLILRDRAGMLLLFVMPAFLVVVITLVQDKVTTTEVEVLFVDDDGGMVGREIHDSLSATGTIRLQDSLDGIELSPEVARDLVARGDYQFAVVVPPGLSDKLREAVRERVEHSLSAQDTGVPPAVPAIHVWFDPTVHGSFRSAVSSLLTKAVHELQARLLLEQTLQRLPEKMAMQLPMMTRQVAAPQMPETKALLPQLFADMSLLPITEQFTTGMGFRLQPSAVQQNVPAWAIFGIFFISVPLAGSLLQERHSGTLRRLRVLPVSYATVMGGKLLAYACVCAVQAAVILAAGLHVLPLLGLPPFSAGGSALPAVALLASVAVAACGYGILLGTLGRTHEQIAVFAPVSIVIGAAIGGIMVPVYALPDLLRPLCYLSPLFWGQSGFYDLLLRQSGWQAILPEMAALLAFGLLAGLGSLILAERRE